MSQLLQKCQGNKHKNASPLPVWKESKSEDYDGRKSINSDRSFKSRKQNKDEVRALAILLWTEAVTLGIWKENSIYIQAQSTANKNGFCLRTCWMGNFYVFWHWCCYDNVTIATNYALIFKCSDWALCSHSFEVKRVNFEMGYIPILLLFPKGT